MLILLPPLVDPILSLVPCRIDRRLEGAFDRDEDWLVILDEPFMVPAIDGRDTGLLFAGGVGGGAMDVRLFDAEGTIDLRFDGVLAREGVDKPGEGLGAWGFVGDSRGFYQSFVRRSKSWQHVGRSSR